MFLSRFFRRRAYHRVLEQEDPDHSDNRVFLGSTSKRTWNLRIHPRFRVRKRGRNSHPVPKTHVGDHTRTSSAHMQRAAVVDNFLAGPSDQESEEEKYQRQCRDLLRKFAASGRVPGYVY